MYSKLLYNLKIKIHLTRFIRNAEIELFILIYIIDLILNHVWNGIS